MKKLLIIVAAMAFSASSQAGVIAGYSDVSDLGGGVYKFTFDTLPGPDIKNQDGLSFGGFGLGLTVTSNAGPVIQDVPAHGGLGVDGGDGGDNMAGFNEVLYFAFSQAVTINAFSLNGLLNSDGHTDAADGAVRFCYALNSCFLGSASGFDGVGTDYAGLPAAFSNISYFEVSPAWYQNRDNFKGYVESITVQLASVPEPATLILFGLGLAGLGLRKKKAA